MSVLMRHHWCRRLFIFTLIFCLMMPTAAMALHQKDESHTNLYDCPFSMLILGDSQMAGAGWEGGYANCIEEAYPKAHILNLAKDGSLLANGDIQAQWELYLSEDLPMPNFVMLDGGINDLSYLKKEGFEEDGLRLVKEALCSLIEQIHAASPDTRIIFVLIPPLKEWEDTEKGPPSYDVQERYWKHMNIVADKYNYVTVLDMFSLNPFHFPCADCYHENFSDSIHLNEAGYRNTFEYIDNALFASLAGMLGE